MKWMLRVLLLLALTIVTTLPAVAQDCASGAQLVSRRAVQLNGGTIKGNLQQLNEEFININGGTVLQGNLLVSGSPNIIDNSPNLDPAQIVCGTVSAAGYGISLNGDIALAGKIVTNVAPVTLDALEAVAAATGNRDAFINTPADAEAFSADANNSNGLRSLFINANTGTVTLAPQAATFANIFTNSGTILVLGREGEATTYNVEGLFVNSGSAVVVLGQVTLRVKNQLQIGSDAFVGNVDSLGSLAVDLAYGDLNLNSGATLFANINAPTKTVAVNPSAVLIGSVKADQIVVNSGGYLEGVTP
jgi:hypothetical protein